MASAQLVQDREMVQVEPEVSANVEQELVEAMEAVAQRSGPDSAGNGMIEKAAMFYSIPFAGVRYYTFEGTPSR